MIEDKEILKLFKTGMSRTDIARHFHVQNYVVEDALRGYPSMRIVKRIIDNPDFEKWFIETYNKTESMKDFVNICCKHSFFKKNKQEINVSKDFGIKKIFQFATQNVSRNIS